ncbi:Diguanylate phosphodiesterase, predicted domain protein, partial [mine drainage metagenome]
DLEKLSNMGVHLAVDDVGTRWSSLRPFKELNVDTVKIDGSFIAGLEPEAGMNRCVVEALLNVSHSLGMSTIAEGIETPQQVAILQEFGVDVGQGFFFAHPLPPKRARELANADTRPIFSLGPGHDSSVRHTEDIQPRLMTLTRSTAKPEMP